MSREQFNNSLPHINIGTIGHVNHGKTTLTAAISRVLSKTSDSPLFPFDLIDTPPVESGRGITLSANHVEYKTKNRHYTHVDCHVQADYVKNMFTGAAQMDGAILVVSAAEGPMPQTREHIFLARQMGVHNIVVFLNKVDLLDDHNGRTRVEREVRDLLKKHEFPGDAIPIVSGSALKALEGDTSVIGEQAILKLMETVDSHIPTPQRAIDKPFLMPIKDVVTVSGRGPMLTGQVARGVIRTQDPVEVVGLRLTQKATVFGVEISRKLLNEGRAGDNLGVLVRGLKRDDVEPGQVLANVGSITSHTRFKARIYLLSKEEGGGYPLLLKDSRSQFCFWTTDVTGTLKLPENVERVMPGANIAIEVELITPVAMEKELHFAICEEGRTVGAGVVTEIIA